MNLTTKQAPKVALITGSARRIGRAIAIALHQAGFDVLIHGLTHQTEAQALVDDLNQQRHDSASLIIADLGRDDCGAVILSTLKQWRQRLDLLVNNASVFFQNDKLNNDPKLWNATFAINVRAPWLLSTHAYDLLAQNQGVIINITDIHAERPLKDYSIYCQSKASLVMQTKALAKEFAPKVRVNAIAPGAIAWPEHDNALDINLKAKIIHNTPLKKHGEPSDIASAVLALANQSFVTGQILAVDGGRSIC